MTHPFYRPGRPGWILLMRQRWIEGVKAKLEPRLSTTREDLDAPDHDPRMGRAISCTPPGSTTAEGPVS